MVEDWTSEFIRIDGRVIYWDEIKCIQTIIVGRLLRLCVNDGSRYRLVRKRNYWKATKTR